MNTHGRSAVIRGIPVKDIQDISSGVADSLVGAEAPGLDAASPGADRSADWNSATTIPDDLSREVYCILGMPIDAIEMPAVLRSIEIAAANPAPFVISTPNLNFLVNSQQDSEFRESLLVSDLCPADGMPIVWIAMLMGIPIKHRIAGSDIIEALKSRRNSEPPLKVFIFGATESVAAAAARSLNVNPAALSCVGWALPRVWHPRGVKCGSFDR